MNRYSLKWKLISLVLLLHLVLFGVLSTLAIRDLRQLVVEQTRLRSESLAAELSAALTAPMLERDYVTLAEVARDITAASDIDYLAIFDKAGREMARAGLVKGAPVPEVEADAAGGGEVFDLAVPLAQGRARVGLRMSGARALLERYAIGAGLWTLLAATLAGFIMSWATLWLTRRLSDLEVATAALGEGDLSARAPKDTHGDEITRLSSAFNRMAEDIAYRINALRLADEAMRQALMETGEEHARLNALLSNLKSGILFIGRDDRVLYANPALRRIWLIPSEAPLIDLPATEALVSSANVLSQPDHFSRLVLRTSGTQEISDSTELEMTDGRVITQLCYPVRDDDYRLIGRLWVFEDVTQEKRSAEQLIYLAERDGLTGLLNRRRFEETLGRAISDAERHRGRLALLLFDLDEFKHLNDNFGHRAGDAMLTRVANEISAVVRKNEVLARLGGDEFAVLVPDLTNDSLELQGLAERIVRAVARIPFCFDGRSLRMTASLGISVYPDHAQTLAELVVCADIAMYRAKESGKNGWRYYDGHPDDTSLERLTWNERIQNALDRDLLVLHYQGIHGTDGRLQHIEALMRMKDEARADALIAPSHFIPLAEKTGKILELDRWAVAATVAELARQPDLPAIAVNVSARSLADIAFPDYILDTLTRHGVAPRRLLLELTETAAMGDLQDARRFLEVLQPAGCRVCLDDFGTGFSSFAYLKHINADVLKIDGQFIRGLADDRDNQIVVRAIVDVARGMGKMTVAECVEDAITLGILCDFGVDAVQGYHLSLPRADAASLMTAVVRPPA